MIQLILHLWGDYIFQSDWMANNKTTDSFACLAHVTLYSLPFLLLRPSLLAFAVIFITHFLIDRFRLAKYLCYAKNFIAPESAIWAREEYALQWGEKDEFQKKYSWENCQATGYPSETVIWLSMWLMIIVDNALHLTINFLALKYL